jgi:hypothetical protein
MDLKNIKALLLSFLMLFGFWGAALGQAVVSGDIIITEFMANPAASPESNGEYIELYNKRSVSIDLNGYIIKDDDSDSHTISSSLIIPAEGFIILSGVTDPLGNGSNISDYQYSGITLANSADEIVLTNSSGNEIARLAYDLSTTNGTSKELNSISNVGTNGEVDDSNFSNSTTEIGAGSTESNGSPESAGSTNLDENPTVRFSQSGATVNESAGTITIEVILEDPDNNSVDVDVVFQQNTSTSEGGDFTSLATQTLSFGTGASDGDTKNASFTLTNDSDYEGTETAEFILSNISTSGDASISGQTEYTLTIEDNETPSVVINEIHADPDNSGTNGDADGDGESDFDDDEFVEIVNSGSVSIDIGGWTISDQDAVRHTFADGTILPANGAAVVFGNAQADTLESIFGGSIVQGTSSMSLVNGGDTVTLKDGDGNTIDSHTYGSEGGENQSLVRDPDITGSFVKHSTATGSGGSLFSPGTKIDGSLFTTSLVIEGNAGWRMLSAPVENMAISEITDDTPIQGFGDGHAKNFYNGYSGSAFTAPGDLTGNLTSGEGFILYFYNNTDASSSTLPVVIDVGSNSEPSSDVNVTVHSAGNGWNLLGNPYQTAFDITSISPTSGSLASAVAQIWSDEDESYILSSTNDDKVAPGQGFFLQNTDAPSVDLPTSGKATGTQFYKEAHQKAFVQLALISEGSNGEGTQRDLSTMLYFHDEAGLDWDKWDAEKIYPLKASYSLLNIVDKENEKIKAQDSRVFKNLGEEVFHLNVESMNVNANQILEWNRDANIPDEWTFTFTDNETGEEIIMDENFSYSFIQDEISSSSAKSASKLSKSLSVNKDPDEKPRFTIKLSKGNATSNEIGNTPESFTLEQNYPNPFNPTTSIQYSVAQAGPVAMTVYNVMGQKVATLVNETKSAGTYRVNWDATNMASGIYHYRLQSAGKVITRQMTLIK